MLRVSQCHWQFRCAVWRFSSASLDHLLEPISAAVRRATEKSGSPVLLRNLARDLPEKVLEDLDTMTLRDFLSLHKAQYVLNKHHDGSWDVALRPPIAPKTLQELDQIIVGDRFTALSDVYLKLSDDARNDVKMHKTLGHLIDALSDTYVLSSARTSVTKAAESLPPDPDRIMMDEDTLAEERAVDAVNDVFVPPPARRVADNVDHSMLSPPPPPPPPTSAPPARRHGGVDRNGSTLSIEQLCPFIPSFFVPAELVTSEMPGYSLEHLEQMFLATRALQVVRLCGTAFIRLHGNYGKFSMNDVVNANEKLREFEPEPETIRHVFKNAFPKEGTWHPLKVVVAKANQEELQKLRYQGPYTLLYFAQLAHLYAFTADNGGAVASISPLSLQLNAANSPCPVAFNEICMLTKDRSVSESELQSQISPEARHQLFTMFSTVEHFVNAHSGVFVLRSGVVMQQRNYQRDMIKERPLAEQLEAAYRAQDKRRIRTIRRKMAVERDPVNPLLEAKSLARAITDFLPPNRHITLFELIRSLPQELTDLLPNSYTKFFRGHPEYFTFFEWRSPNNFCVLRAGIPLPDGVLRGTYDELSLIACIVRQFQRTSRPTLSASEISVNLPQGARESIKQQYGSLLNLIANYPENFVVVRSSVYTNASDFNVTLASVPSALFRSVSEDTQSTTDSADV